MVLPRYGDNMKSALGQVTAVKNGINNPSGKIRISVNIPMRVIEALNIVPGDQLVIGSIENTKINVPPRAGRFVKKQPSDNEVSN